MEVCLSFRPLVLHPNNAMLLISQLFKMLKVFTNLNPFIMHERDYAKSVGSLK
jgi:hypothetical protein